MSYSTEWDAPDCYSGEETADITNDVFIAVASLTYFAHLLFMSGENFAFGLMMNSMVRDGEWGTYGPCDELDAEVATFRVELYIKPDGLSLIPELQIRDARGWRGEAVLVQSLARMPLQAVADKSPLHAALIERALEILEVLAESGQFDPSSPRSGLDAAGAAALNAALQVFGGPEYAAE